MVNFFFSLRSCLSECLSSPQCPELPFSGWFWRIFLSHHFHSLKFYYVNAGLRPNVWSNPGHAGLPENKRLRTYFARDLKLLGKILLLLSPFPLPSPASFYSSLPFSSSSCCVCMMQMRVCQCTKPRSVLCRRNSGTP